MRILLLTVVILAILMATMASAQDSWPMFRGNPGRTGYATATGDLKEDFLISWTFTAPNGIFASPAVADLNGDGKLEIVVPLDKERRSPQESLIVLSNTGRVMWRFVTRGGIHSSPTISDVNGDGTLDVIFGTNDAEIYALDGKTGQELWSIDTLVGAFRSSPLAYDLDGDNNVEVFIGSSNGSLYKIDGESGIVEWRYQTGGEISSSPSLNNLDGDDDLELFFASESGVAYALEGDGTLLWNVSLGAPVVFSTGASVIINGGMETVIGTDGGKLLFIRDGVIQREFDANASISSSPGVVPGNDSVVVFGTAIEENLHGVYLKYSRNKIFGVDGNGREIWSLPTGGWSVFSSPALADIDRDGEIEAVIGSREGRLYVIGTESGVVDWEYLGGTGLFASPVLVDLDDDNDLEIIVGYLFSNQIKVIDSPDKPDLVVEEIAFSDNFPETADEISIRIKVKNIGDLESADSSLKIYRRSPILDHLIGNLSVKGLATGEVANLTFTWEFRAAEGEVGIYVEADSDDELNESDEGNNGLYEAFKNDLFISDYEFPGGVGRGMTKVDVSISVGNKGRLGLKDVGVMLLLGAIADMEEVASGTVDVGAGDEASVKLSFLCNSSSSNVLNIVLDPNNEVDEADETNNIVSGELETLAAEGGGVKPAVVRKKEKGVNPIVIIILIGVILIIVWKKGLKKFRKKKLKGAPPAAGGEATPGAVEAPAEGVTTADYSSQMVEAPPPQSP